MNAIYHPSDLRGHANHGWLKTWHSFSFAGWYDPSRVHFGALRVLNDDYVAAGMGFAPHPHDNMEIVTIMMDGTLEHQDSMGHKELLRAGEVQAMSAGTGIQHSERNASDVEPLHLFQIWIFPREKNTKPRYAQKSFEHHKTEGAKEWNLLVSPDGAAGSLEIGQDTWFTMGTISEQQVVEYQLHKPGNGVYVFVVSGSVVADEFQLHHRDALGITETDNIKIKATEESKLLVIEVPMHW
jgi:redox-sensitive bicupin YhaK (pirin superfamily)